VSGGTSGEDPSADHFPEIGMPSTEERDLRTLLRDRHPWVRRRTRVQHRLQAIALHHALRRCTARWSAAGPSARQALPLPPDTSPRRDELLAWYAQLQKRRQELDKAVQAPARHRPPARRRLTPPGVGPVTALATAVFLGDPSRLATGNQVTSSIGMIPREHSSGKTTRFRETEQARATRCCAICGRKRRCMR
jgi:transposase